MNPDRSDRTSTRQPILDGYRALIAFQESFEPPDGVTLREYMSGCTDVMNAYPASEPTSVDVLIREVAGWQVRASITRATSGTVAPVIVFFHGGGWSMGNRDTHRRLALDLTLSGCAVVSVDYRRLPRHRFPAQIDDAMTAVDWVANHADTFAWDANRIVLAGDSAGATLAAVAAQALAEGRGHRVKSLLLFYGIFDYHDAVDLLHPAVLRLPQEAGNGYLPPEEFERLRMDPLVSPLYGCSQLPATYLNVGTKDPLLAQSQAMAATLDTHRVVNELHVLHDAPHGFMQLPFLGSYLAGQLSVHDFLKRHAWA